MQLLFSPITLIILAIAALAIGVYYLITRWDDIKAALMDTAAFQWVMDVAGKMGAWFGTVWDGISQGWEQLVAYISMHSPLDAFQAWPPRSATCSAICGDG
ncbi:hypothetical protein O0544_17085 [Edwardsiella anguillarum]|nr:hypothetical protein [Edwardsiella anguillarum]